MCVNLEGTYTCLCPSFAEKTWETSYRECLIPATSELPWSKGIHADYNFLTIVSTVAAIVFTLKLIVFALIAILRAILSKIRQLSGMLPNFLNNRYQTNK